jgi:hypothetical protein
MGNAKNTYTVLIWKRERKKPLGGHRRRWQSNIITNIGLEGMHWIHVTQDGDNWWTLVNKVMNLQIPIEAGNFKKDFEPWS